MSVQDSSSVFQSAIEVSHRLRAETGFKSVHVVPAGVTAWGGWNEPPPFPHDEPPFSTNLGSYAAQYFAYELANALVIRSQELAHLPKAQRVFRIGVASGSTIRALVDAFELPEQFVKRWPKDLLNLSIVVTPLVIGPVPETVSSAGYIAGDLANKFPDGMAVLQPVIDIKPDATGFRIEMREQSKIHRDIDPLVLFKGGRSELEKSPMCFDWVLTGVGSVSHGQLEAHMLHRFQEKDYNRLKKTVVGDICSRLFNNQGSELEEADGNKFVVMTFRWLRFLANLEKSKSLGRRVVAIAGGEEKYEALRTLVLNSIKPDMRLFNVLFTDEITGRKLLREVVARNNRKRSARSS